MCKHSFIVSQYTYDATGNQNNPASIAYTIRKIHNARLQLPRINHFGIRLPKGRQVSWLVPTITTGNWSDLSIAGVNAGLAEQ